MNDLNKFAKIFLYITILFFILWLGGYVGRNLVVYRLFETEGLGIKSIFTEPGLSQISYLLVPAIIYNLITYTFFIISLVIFLFASHINLKNEGWLFISVAIIFITLPFEVHLMTIDFSYVSSIFTGSFNGKEMVEMLRERMIRLSSFSLIEIFSYFVIIGLFLFRPLRKLK